MLFNINDGMGAFQLHERIIQPGVCYWIASFALWALTSAYFDADVDSNSCDS